MVSPLCWSRLVMAPASPSLQQPPLQIEAATRCREPHTSCQLPLLSTLFHITSDVKNDNISRCPPCVSECYYRHAVQSEVTMTTAWPRCHTHSLSGWGRGQLLPPVRTTFTTFTFTELSNIRHGQFGVYTVGLKRDFAQEI